MCNLAANFSREDIKKDIGEKNLNFIETILREW
jgi:hypothetical protein